MKLVALSCAALALALPAFALTATSSGIVAASVVDYPQVKQVDCAGGRGSAFYTTKGWVSVAHVTNGLACSIDGTPIGATPEKGRDFSRVDYDRRVTPLKINCDGMKVGTYVWAIGYAGGYSWLTMTRHLVTYKVTDEGLRMLLGSPTVIPGMSGGPIINEAGEVVGTVNAYNKLYPVSFSVELKDTDLC
jgi:hypothetical protein